MIDISGMKILLVRNDNIGDLICTTPAIEALRKKYPNNQIDIVVNSYNYNAIDKNPFINTVYTYTKPKHTKGPINKIKAALGKLKILMSIREEKYDVVIVFRNSYSKSAAYFAKITNAKYKVGVQEQNTKGPFNIIINKNLGDKHEVEFCFDCVKEFGINYTDEKTLYYIPKYLIEKYSSYKNKIIFHISARMKNNQTSFDKLKEIINSLNLSNILITAEPKDFSMAQQLTLETQANFIKTTSFLDYGGLLKNAKLLITLEGGSMHLGPAVGTKTVALLGQSKISRWYPWGYKKLCLQDKSKKAENISTKKIISLLKDLLNEI